MLLYIAVLDELTVCLYTQDGVAALHMAAQEGKVDVVRLLTEAQAQINIQAEVHTYTIMSCLMIALLNKSTIVCIIEKVEYFYLHSDPLSH